MPSRAASPLRGQLEFFVDGEAAQIERFSAGVIARDGDPALRRGAQLWKMAVIPELRSSLLRADDQAALLHLWARNAQMEHFFEQGPGAEQFGPHAADGRALFHEVVARLDNLAERELGPERIGQARALIERYSQGHPLEVDPLQAAVRDSELNALLRDSLGKPLDVVMQPLRAINPGAGLDDTARAVAEFSATVDEVRRDLGHLPERIRWESEVLLLDLDDNRSRQEAQQSLGELAESAERLTRTAEVLPAELEQRVARVLEDLAARQVELRATLADGTSAAHALTETAQAIDAALATFQRLSADLSGPPRAPDAPAPPPGKPFDIEDYTRTAEALTASLTELNAALERVRELSAPESSARLAALVDASVAAATRRLFLSAAGLVLLAAAAYGVARRWSAR